MDRSRQYLNQPMNFRLFLRSAYKQKQILMSRFVRQRDSQKWGKQWHSDERYILTLADMDLPIYQPFKKSIVQRMSSINNFTYKNPSEDYFKSIIQWYHRRHIRTPFTLQKGHIVESPSLLNIIYLLIDKLTAENDAILLLTPVYNYYERVSKYLKRKVVESRLYAERRGQQVRYDINFADLEEKAKLCKVMIFCNPHNPSGRIWTKKQIERIVQICKSNSIMIISDEILCDLTPSRYANKFFSLVNLPYERIVVCNSISKAFNAESLRGGYAIIKHEPLRKTYRELINQLNLYTNEFAIICTETFYSQEGEEWIGYALSVIHQNYNELLKQIKGTLLLVSELEAAFIITINFEGYLKFIERWFYEGRKEGPRRNMVSCFLESEGIRGIEMIYGSPYGDILSDIRFTIAVESDYFAKFASKLRTCLLQLEYEHKELRAAL